MSAKRQWALVCVAVVALVAALVGCTHLFTGSRVPTLLLGEVTITADRGQILLSAKNMPDGGLASVAVTLGGIIYDVAKIDNVSVEGLSGFEVPAQQFAGGNGGFVLVHPSAGLPAGAFAKITFDATGDPTLADFAFSKGDISLADDSYHAVSFQLQDEYAYYAK